MPILFSWKYKERYTLKMKKLHKIGPSYSIRTLTVSSVRGILKNDTNELIYKTDVTERQKITANHVTYKGLISKIQKQLIQLNIKNQTTQSKNGQKT